MIKTISKKKKCKKAKWLSEEDLQAAEKTREVKGKGKIFPSECRVPKNSKEENNRMGKTRDLFKKIRDTEGTFHAKMGRIKDKNGMDLTDAEDIKKRWREYTEL